MLGQNSMKFPDPKLHAKLIKQKSLCREEKNNGTNSEMEVSSGHTNSSWEDMAARQAGNVSLRVVFTEVFKNLVQTFLPSQRRRLLAVYFYFM